MKQNKFLTGIILAVISSVFWAVGGNFTQYIYKYSDFNFLTLTAFRMLVAGGILTIFAIITNDKKIFLTMITTKSILIPLIIFSIFAQIGVQVPFFATIKYSSAAFATLISALAPTMVIIYISIKNKKRPKNFEIFLILTMLIGLFFIITNASIKKLLVDPRAIFFGIISASCFSFYLLYSTRFEKFPGTYTVGITMLIGSLFILPFSDFNMIVSNLSNINILVFFLLLIFIGTIIPFYTFLECTKYISPKIASVLSVLEPVTSLFITIFIFKQNFTIIQIIGSLLVILSIISISYLSENNF